MTARALRRVHSQAGLEGLAQRCLPRSVFDFYQGGAEDESTLRRNRVAFEAVELLPRALVDVSRVDTTVQLMGASAGLPLAVAPMGAVGFGRRDGEIAMARAAAQAGVPFVLSTAATVSIERIAAEAGGRLWFQLYPLKLREASFRLVERARQAGYEALVVTIDVPVGGKRERDLRNDFSMPFGFTARNIADFASRPRWALDMLRRGLPVPVNMSEFGDADASATERVATVGREFDPAFAWPDLAELRERWPGKLLVKGVLRADDAAQAARLGCDGVIVSNHGGRQLDGAVAALDALPAIVDAVGDRCDVLVDGGVRRGSDIVKALAVGARAVLVGRPLLYGVCAAGEEGARLSLAIFQDELIRCLRLCGTPRASGIDSSLLRPDRPARRA